MEHKIPYQVIKQITNNYNRDRILGSGGFGTVYKAVYENGATVAVKVFDVPRFDDSEFRKEFDNLKRLRHENIVQLLGFCNDTEEVVFKDANGKQVPAVKLHTALCLEYVQNGDLGDYISDESTGLDWPTRYKIIKGVCEGLRYLHNGISPPILHLDLKPQNILLDKEMIPKISDFGLSRLFGEHKTTKTTSTHGTIGYMPPEYTDFQVISEKFDIYSLGVIMVKIITGRDRFFRIGDVSRKVFIDQVHDNWRRWLCRNFALGLLQVYCQQVRRCIGLALDCMKNNPQERPTMHKIVSVLIETETMIGNLNIEQGQREGKYYMIQEEVELLEVQPQELYFPFEPNQNISCLLQLRNKGDDHVAFMLVSENPSRYLSKLPLCSILPHRCTYTYIITMHKQQQHLPSDSGEFFTLHSVAVGELELEDLERRSMVEEYRNFFKEAREVQEVALTVKCDPPVHQEPTRPTIEIIIRKDTQAVSSIDVHPTEPWVMMASKGSIHVWNYKTMTKLSLFEEDIEETVHVAKFLEREKWIVAGDANGGIHVYSYDERDEVKFVRAHDSSITSLSLHPTLPFLLSSSEDADNLIKLWDWGKNWEGRTFPGHADKVVQVTFNSNSSGCFTSASLDRTVKIWSIHNGDADITLVNKYASLLCFDNFVRSNQQHLIAGSMDGTAQIWNMESKGDGYVYRLEGHSGRVSATNLHPELPMLITGSFDGTVRLWNSDTYKLDHTINFSLGQVCAFGFIKDPIRIVVGCQQGIAIMEISMC